VAGFFHAGITSSHPSSPDVPWANSGLSSSSTARLTGRPSARHGGPSVICPWANAYLCDVDAAAGARGMSAGATPRKRQWRVTASSWRPCAASKPGPCGAHSGKISEAQRSLQGSSPRPLAPGHASGTSTRGAALTSCVSCTSTTRWRPSRVTRPVLVHVQNGVLSPGRPGTITGRKRSGGSCCSSAAPRATRRPWPSPGLGREDAHSLTPWFPRAASDRGHSRGHAPGAQASGAGGKGPARASGWTMSQTRAVR
jgi:hypothetical protein